MRFISANERGTRNRFALKRSKVPAGRTILQIIKAGATKRTPARFYYPTIAGCAFRDASGRQPADKILGYRKSRARKEKRAKCRSLFIASLCLCVRNVALRRVVREYFSMIPPRSGDLCE